MKNGLALFKRGLQCAFVWCGPLACAFIYHANVCPCLCMYELAAFREMLFLNVIVVSMCLIFFASLNDSGSARCFTSRHTSPDLVWDVTCKRCFAFHMAPPQRPQLP